MADTTAAPAKPSSSVKLVLLGEAAVGKVRVFGLRIPSRQSCPMLIHGFVPVFSRAALRER